MHDFEIGDFIQLDWREGAELGVNRECFRTNAMLEYWVNYNYFLNMDYDSPFQIIGFGLYQRRQIVFLMQNKHVFVCFSRIGNKSFLHYPIPVNWREQYKFMKLHTRSKVGELWKV